MRTGSLFAAGKSHATKVDAGLHQRRDEVHVARQAVQLGNHDGRAMQPVEAKRLGNGPNVSLPTVYQDFLVPCKGCRELQ